MYDTWILWVFCWVFFGQYLFIFFRHVFFCVLEGKESYWLFCIVSPKNRHSHSAIHLCAPIQKDDWWKAQYLLLLTAVPELSIRLLFEWLKGFDRLWLQFGHPLIDLVQQLTSFMLIRNLVLPEQWNWNTYHFTGLAHFETDVLFFSIFLW